MTTVNFFILSPEESIVWGRASETDVAACTASTHKWCLTTILLSETGRLESEVVRNGLKLLELELVHAACSDEGQQNQRRKPGKNHDGGGSVEGGRRVDGGCNQPL